jgi:hypothetical protein
MTIKTTAPILGALTTAALVIAPAPAPALASAATGHRAPPPPGSHPRTGRPVALAPDRLRLRADRQEAGYALSLL